VSEQYDLFEQEQQLERQLLQQEQRLVQQLEPEQLQELKHKPSVHG